MKSFNEYRGKLDESNSSNKVEGMADLVDAIRKWGEKYDTVTRKFVWEHLNSPRGKELMHKILRNPKTYYPNSEFTKLVQKK